MRKSDFSTIINGHDCCCGRWRISPGDIGNPTCAKYLCLNPRTLSIHGPPSLESSVAPWSLGTRGVSYSAGGGQSQVTVFKEIHLAGYWYFMAPTCLLLVNDVVTSWRPLTHAVISLKRLWYTFSFSFTTVEFRYDHKYISYLRFRC